MASTRKRIGLALGLAGIVAGLVALRRRSRCAGEEPVAGAEAPREPIGAA